MPEKDPQQWDGVERRKRGREDLLNDLVTALRSELDGLKPTHLDETHVEHHVFIAEWIEDRRRSRERWDKIKAQVGGWAIVSILGAIGTSAYHALQYMREHLK